MDFILYSPQTDMFMDIAILFEFVPGGMVFVGRSARASFLDRYPMKTRDDKMVVGLEVCLSACRTLLSALGIAIFGRYSAI